MASLDGTCFVRLASGRHPVMGILINIAHQQQGISITAAQVSNHRGLTLEVVREIGLEPGPCREV